MSQPLWQPSAAAVENSRLAAFMAAAKSDYGCDAADYGSLWTWSVERPEAFWRCVWDFAGIVAAESGGPALADADRMPGAKFFPEARLNYAENLLRRRDDGTDAIVFWGEDRIRRRLSWRELYDTVSRLAQALRSYGIEPGDRVAAYIPNMPEAIIGLLATSAVGAVWSSCSPDFGVRGVVDRFGQIGPKVLLSADGYHYNGKSHSSLDKLPDILSELQSVERVLVVPYVDDAPDVSSVAGAVPLADALAPFQAEDIDFAALPFDHPLYILYSSGTTGVPKCIVHGAGGALLKHATEQPLMCDVGPGDRAFWFTTCGWMMWNWLVTNLAWEATVLLYDGSPFYPDGNVVFDLADAEKMTLFGTSAKFLDAVNKAGLTPRETHDLSSVRLLGSTGSPLVPEGFDFVYRDVKPDVHLASVSGGTDICGCFVGGSPISPVWRGEIQAPVLGMAVEIFDEDGQPMTEGKGELVCTRPFPSMPVKFWNDPEGERYRAAYFERFPGIWCHGDYVGRTEHGGYVIYGRSDAVLNPGGVRIGTAEIYRQVERLDEVVESIVIGQEWQGDVRVVLFVRLRDGLALEAELIDRIRRQIRANTTPRHVPAKVVQVSDIPRTKSGKIVELAVRDVVHGRPIRNQEALANPEALALYADLPELST